MAEWRAIQGYEGRYEVSDEGQIRSLWDRHGQRKSPLVLAQSRTSHGYPCVNLRGGGKSKTIQVHKAVLRAFVGPRPEGMQARHLDDNQTNNRLDNLAWGTHAENVADAVRHNRYKSGEKHWNARLTAEAVAEIRRSAGLESHASIAGRLGVSRTTVTNVLSGVSWAR